MDHRHLSPLVWLAVTLFVTACGDQPTSPRNGHGPRALIFDGSHEQGNKDVFFLPPLVPNPSALFDAKFNPNLTPVFDVCPTADLDSDVCSDVPIAKFGHVAGATGPITVSVEDQHYLALYHTGDDPNLDPGVYLLRVFFEAPASGDKPVAWAHMEVVGSGRELKNVADETIALLDGRTLPIKVRFETDCESANCVSEIVTNDGKPFSDPLVLESGDGALVLTPGWLPPGISAARVTLQRHDPGPDNDCVGKAAFTGLGLVAQRQACLEVTTDPPILATDPENPEPTKGIRAPAYIFVCLELESEDPLEPFLQIIKADDGRPLQALPDVSDDLVQESGFDLECGEDEGIGSTDGLLSHPVLRLAGRALGTVARPVARLFEVKPLYAIDLGQGGEISLFDGFSFFTPGVMASAHVYVAPPGSATVGEVVSLGVQIRANTNHVHEPGGSAGVPAVDVEFTSTGGLLSDPNFDGEPIPPPASVITVATGFGEGAGIAMVDLTVGAGTNVVTAVALVNGQPVTEPIEFTVNGTATPLLILSYSDPALPDDDDASTAGDVTSVQLVFNREDGTYEVTWTADPAHPFNGNLRLNLNLGNTRLGGDLVDLPGIFSNVESQTQLSYTGTAAALTTWLVGDLIVSTGESPQFATSFNSGLVDLDDISLSNRDLVQQIVAEILPSP